MFYMKMLFRRGSSRSREFSIVENHPLLSYFFLSWKNGEKRGVTTSSVRDVTHYTFRLWLCYLCVNCLYEAIISFFYILCSLKDFLFLSCLTKKHIEIVGEKTGGKKPDLIFFSKIFDFYFLIFKKEKKKIWRSKFW